MKLSIVIPVYNECAYLPRFWEELRRAPIGACRGIDRVEILVVDDGSTDGSQAVLESLGGSLELECGITAEVRLTKLMRNRGKGFAVRTAIDQSTGDIVLIQDADQEYSMSDYPKLVAPIVDDLADVVFGNRFGGNPRRVLYFWHAVVNRFLTLLANALGNLTLSDMETGFKVFRGDLIRSLRLTSDRFGIEPEITARLARSGARIYETDISYFGRTYEQGKKIGPLDGVAALLHILRFNLLDREPYKPSLFQTLHALDCVSESIYAPAARAAMSALGERRDRRILEVGAGIGSLTRVLAEFGTVTGTDISDEFLRHLRRRFHLDHRVEARRWDATAAPWLGAGEFDCVVAFNVLEHLEDDVGALRTWASMLAGGGSIVVYVPNYPWLFSKVDEHAGHVRRYDKVSLARALDAAGLDVRHMTFHNSLGILGWLVDAKLRGKGELSRGKLRLYAVMKTLLGWVERRFDRRVGLSIVAVATKKAETAQVRRAS